jgi:competence protein ComEA
VPLSEEKPVDKEKVLVAMMGAVNKPDVYTVDVNDRLKDLLQKAGGLSKQADTEYFSKTFNLAQKVVDQQKFYIPSKEDVLSGYLSTDVENNSSAASNSSSDAETLVNINSAGLAQLDTLPSVGSVTAQKIIDGRPYQDLQELLDKKVVTQSVWDKIKPQITL